MNKTRIFILFIFMALLSFSFALGEEKPDIKLPEITILGKDKSETKERIEPEEATIEIKEEIGPIKDLAREPALEINLPVVEDKLTALKKKNLTSSLTISGGNFSSLNYQYLYGQKIKEANILFILNRDKSSGFIINNQRYHKHSGDKISLNLALPLKVPKLERGFFLSTETEYKEKEENLPFYQNKEIIKNLSFSLKGEHFKTWNSELSFVFSDIKTKLIHENMNKTKSDNINLDLYLYTNLKKYFLQAYPLNLSLKIERETIENTKKWNYLTFIRSNNIEIGRYIVNLGASYHNYNNSSTLGFKIDTFYPYRKDMRIFATFERKAELPTFSEIYGEERYIEANLYFPQKLNYGECGLQYQVKKDFLISSSILAKEVKNFISWRDINNNQLYEPFNIQKVKITGLELEAKKEIFPHVTCLSNFTYNLSIRNKTSDQEVPFLSKKEVKTNLKVTNFKGINVEFIGIYKGSCYASHNQNNKLGSFFVLDFNTYKSVEDHLEIFISGNNFLNKKYQIRPGYFGDLATIRAGITIKI